jgi:hypothetical protein
MMGLGVWHKLEKRNTHEVFVGEHKGNGLLGIIRLKWEGLSGFI